MASRNRSQPQKGKFARVRKTVATVRSAERALRDKRAFIEDAMKADHEELVRREKRRAFLAGSWVLGRCREWFDAEDQREKFLAWLGEVDTRAADRSLFADDADDDLLTPDRLEEISAAVDREAGAEVAGRAENAAVDAGDGGKTPESAPAPSAPASRALAGSGGAARPETPPAAARAS